MTVEQILKMGGFPNTEKGKKAFYKAYPTKDSFIKKFGGVAFPQAPSADEFFSNTFAPNSPRGFYAEGGMTNEIAFPMQPPADYFFSAYPFTPEYQGGGTVSQVWQQVTGTPWSEAKKQGLTDGSYDANIALMQRLQAGEFGSNKGSQNNPVQLDEVRITPKEYRDPARREGDSKNKTLPSKKDAKKVSKENSKPIMIRTEEDYKKSFSQPYSQELKDAQIEWNIKKIKEGKSNKDIKKENLSSETPLNLQSGMITDRNKNIMYVIKNGKVVKQFNVGTGANRDVDVSDIPNLSVDELDKMSAKEAKKYKTTPRGAYLSIPKGPEEMYGKPGFWMNPINYGAFPDKSTLPKNLAQHLLYGIGPKGTHGYDPVEGARRMKLMKGPGEKRNFSYGCTNMYGEDIDCLTGQLFPKGDTTFVVDTRLKKDVEALKKFGIKQYGGLPGGANDMPCFECGGYMQDGGEEGGAVNDSAFGYGQFPAIMEDGGEEYAKGGWIKKVSKSMEKRGTKGSFTKYCGGKVTDECIQRGLNSSNPLTRKRAGLAKAFRSIAKKQEGGDAGYGLDPNDVGKERSGYFMDILNRNRENANIDSMIDEAMQYEDYMNAAQMPMAQLGMNQTNVNMPGAMYNYAGDFNWSMRDDTNYAKAQNNQMWGDYVSNQEDKYNTGASFGNLASTYLMGMGAKQQYLKPKKTKSEILSGYMDVPGAPQPNDRPTDNMPTAQRGYQVPFSEQIQGMPYPRTIPQAAPQGRMAAYPMLDRNNDGISDYAQDPNYVRGVQTMESINYMDQYKKEQERQIRDAEARMKIQNPALATSSGNAGGKWWQSLGQMLNQQQTQPGTQGSKTTTPGSQTTNQGTGQPSSGLTVAYGPVTYGPQGWGKSRFRNYNEAYTAPQDVWASRVTKKRGIIPWNKTLTYEFWHSPTQRAQMQTQEKQDPAASNAVTNTNTATNTTATNTAATNAANAAVTSANNATNNNVTPGPGGSNTPGKTYTKQGGGNPNSPADNAYERMEPINPLPGMIQQQRDQSIAEQEAKMQLTEPDPYFKTTNQFKVKTADPYRADKEILAARFATNILENRNLEPTRQTAREKRIFAEANRRGLEQGDNYRGIWDPNQGNINPYRVVAGTLGDTYTTQYGGMPSYVIPYAQYGGMPYDFYQMGGQYMDNDYGYMQEGGDMEDHVGYYTDEEIEEMRRNNPGMQIDFLD
jgi:hypothetical protein